MPAAGRLQIPNTAMRRDVFLKFLDHLLHDTSVLVAETLRLMLPTLPSLNPKILHVRKEKFCEGVYTFEMPPYNLASLLIAEPRNKAEVL